MKQTEFSRKFEELGLVDSRAGVVFGVLDGPNGNGTCLACVNGNVLSFVECGWDQKPGEVYYAIPLSEIQIKKASSFALHPVFAFTYKGSRFKLTKFGAAKHFLAVIMEEACK